MNMPLFLKKNSGIFTRFKFSKNNSVKENEEIVNKFLKSHPDFLLEDFPHPLTQQSTGGILRISPAPEDCDAMFAARFRRKNL